MSFFDWLFNKTTLPTPPNIRFGRYSDTYKTKNKYESWEKSLLSFDNQEFIDCYRHFFDYLKDDVENNVHLEENDNKLHFSLLQGSESVNGTATKDFFTAEVRIAKTNNINIGLLRRILDQNSQLTYSAYALNEAAEIVIRFTTHAADGSPYKIYYGLKEIATSADKQDDLLLHEFDTLQIIDPKLRLPMPDAEKEVKYDYVIGEIKKVFEQISLTKINLEQQPKAASYLLLDVLFRLEYLVCPEGVTMDIFERAQRQFFATDNKTPSQKNAALKKELQQLLDLSKVDFFKEMYRTKTTFGITHPAGHDQFVTILDTELPPVEWYEKGENTPIAQAICDHIVGFSLFNYALPKPDKELLHLYMEIMHQDFFNHIGFQLSFREADGAFDKKQIRRYVAQILEQNKENYPNFSPDLTHVDFSSPLLFAKSYLLMVKGLDLMRA